jgi:rare lipoprotein A
MPNESFDSAAWHIPRRLAQAAFALLLAASATTNTNVATAQPAGEPKVAASVAPARPSAPNLRAPHAPPRCFDGLASYYSEDSLVATGARFDPNGLTAAHRWLAFGTRVRVSDPSTGRSVVITINDRGPFVPGRVLDLSLGAARALGMQSRGVGRVHGEVLYAGGRAPKMFTHVKTPKDGIISAGNTKRPTGNVRRPATLPVKADAKSSRA